MLAILYLKPVWKMFQNPYITVINGPKSNQHQSKPHTKKTLETFPQNDKALSFNYNASSRLLVDFSVTNFVTMIWMTLTVKDNWLCLIVLPSPCAKTFILPLSFTEPLPSFHLSFSPTYPHLEFRENRDPCGWFAWLKNICWTDPVTWMWKLWRLIALNSNILELIRFLLRDLQKQSTKIQKKIAMRGRWSITFYAISPFPFQNPQRLDNEQLRARIGDGLPWQLARDRIVAVAGRRIPVPSAGFLG